MARLYIFAEGQTEQTYAGTVLKRHLASFGVFVQGPILVAHSRRRGKIHRGGARNYLALKNDILRLIAQEKSRDVFFTTMIDLYALPGDFPGLQETAPLRHVPYERVKVIEGRFDQDIVDPFGQPSRFVPYIQLHEFEAVLLCQPSKFQIFFEDCARQVKELEETLAGKLPELVDDGVNTAPSKRICSVFPDYEGAKPTAGPQIAEAIGLPTIRRQCPHFDAWLKKLESLGTR